MWDGLDELAAGEVDAVYVKGSLGVDEAQAAGAVVAVNLDDFPDLANRVNNGTPRPLTVHEDLLRDHPEVVVQFLVQTLRASAWAANDLDAVRAILQEETWSGPEGVRAAYGDGFHTSLAPDLSDERVALLGRHKDFLYRHGFLTRDFRLADWVDRAPLDAALAIVAEDAALTPA
jgi:2'-hydroxybiphenyl-2-sulfinate desulfinase